MSLPVSATYAPVIRLYVPYLSCLCTVCATCFRSAHTKAKVGCTYSHCSHCSHYCSQSLSFSSRRHRPPRNLIFSINSFGLDRPKVDMLLHWATLQPQGPSNLAAIRFSSPVIVHKLRIFPFGERLFENEPSITRRARVHLAYPVPI